MFNPIENATTQILRNFAEEYIRLAELIVLFDKDSWDLIESAEREVKKRILMGERTAFVDERAATRHFMLKKVELVEKNINSSSAVRQAQTALSRFLSKHSYESKSFGLYFRNPPTLSSVEIFANYHILVERMPSLVIAPPYGKK